MNEHAGQGCILSVLIIVAFTLIFHEADRPSPPQVAASPAQARRAVDPRSGPLEASPDFLPRVSERPPVVAAEPVPSLPTRPSDASAAPPAPKPSIVAASTVTLIGLSRPVATEGRAISTVQPSSGPGRSEFPAPPDQPIPPTLPRPATLQPRRPASSATIIREGERLSDVAVRVYGTPDAARRLWQANRDRLRGVDAPVAAGLLIRTP